MNTVSINHAILYVGRDRIVFNGLNARWAKGAVEAALHRNQLSAGFLVGVKLTTGDQTYSRVPARKVIDRLVELSVEDDAMTGLIRNWGKEERESEAGYYARRQEAADEYNEALEARRADAAADA